MNPQAIQLTREMLTNLVNENKADEVAHLYDREIDGVEVDEINRRNLGDGRPLYSTLKFSFPDGGEPVLVTVDGVYSSYDSPYWQAVYFSEPFTHTEIRYRKITK